MRLLLSAAATVVLAFPAAAGAATFTVTKTVDTLDGSCTPADCSLREAIAASNATGEDETPVADTVVLPSGTYPLTLPDPGDDESGGDLDINDSMTLVGAGARSTIIQSNGGDRVIQTDSHASVEISGVTLTGGGGVDQGGGMFSSSTLSLHDAAIVGNATTKATPATGRQGGGLFVNRNPATLERVLIAGNSAASIAGDQWAPQGGGLFLNNTATLVNVTISGNTLDGTGGGSSGPQGAGLFVNGASTLTNVTIAGNTAVDNGTQGGGIFFNDATTVLRSIVAGNTGGMGPDECFVNDTVTSAAANLASDAPDCGFTAAGDISADPLLAALADTGGPTDTRALGAGSPALDRAPFGECPALDQRGFARSGAGTACDLGAHEQGAGAPAGPPVVPPATTPPVVPIAAAAPTPRPPAKLVASKVFTLPSVKECVSRRLFRIRLRQPKGVKLKEARVFVNGKRVKVVRGKRLTAPIDLRGLPKGRFTVKITATTTDGRTVSDKRRYRTCAPKRRGS